MNPGKQQLPAGRGGLRQPPLGWLPLIALLLTMWLAAGCIVTPIGAQEAGATPGAPAATIAIAPVSGAPGDTIFVSGAGWQPNEVVYINLEVVPDTEPVETTVAIATADAEGRFTASFAYPIDPAWAEPGLLDVVAYSLENGTRAVAPFEVLEGEPVEEEPTVEATATVTPTATATPLPGATATPVPQQAAPPTATPTRVTSTGNTGVVLSSALNVREGPSTAFRILRAIPRGTEFTVLGQNNSGAWLLVRLSDGLEGWLARAYTNYTGRAPVVPSPRPPAPQVTPTPSRPPYITGWRGEYFNNTNLSGAPDLVRDDARIDFDWGYNSPARSIRNDNFSARWVRNVFLPAGTYRFYARADDGVRVWVDGTLIIDEWHASSGRTFSAERRLDSGSHLIRVEFYEASQIARVQVWWEEVGEFGDWRGEYFANTDLSGPPAFVRNEQAIDYDWGRGGPANNFPADRFSVRWTRNLHFDAGTYRFHLRVDDGARVYVDNQLIIDEWRNGSVREVTSDIYLDYGVHSLRVEYYEDTGEAVAQLWWERIAEPDQPDDFDDWKGEYWTNRDLDGSPRVVRDDKKIDFNWGSGSPDSRIPSDNFSARWTQHIDFRRGTYRFYARADDGVRVYVGDKRIINEWHDNRADKTYHADIKLDGRERVKVEYYERTGGALIEVWWERIEDDDRPDNPFVNVRPSEGGPGTTVVVEGGGFPANRTVNLYLGGLVGAASLDATQAQVYATTRTDGDGEFAMSFSVPATWPDGTPLEAGTLVVLVATSDFGVEASATFNFVPPPPATAPEPYANVSPSRGGPGTRVTVSGGGFPANTTVNVHLAGLAGVAAAEPRSYASTRTDGQGNYTVSFNMPDEWPDDDDVETGKIIILVATGDFRYEATTEFNFFRESDVPDVSINVSPGSGSAGTRVTVSGSGFPANSSVSLYLGTLDKQVGRGDEQVYATTTADRDGDYTLTFTMPRVWPDGSPVETGRIVILVANSDFSITASDSFNYTAPSDGTPIPTPTPTSTPVVQPTPTEAPYAEVSPSRGGEGTDVTVTGGGFPPLTTVSVMLAEFDESGVLADDAERYATGSTDENGRYTLVFEMPGEWPDGRDIEEGRLLVVVATDDFDVQAGTTFRYTGSVSAQAEATAAVTETLTLTPTTEAPAEPPTEAPVETPTEAPTAEPTPEPTATEAPTAEPTATEAPTQVPTETPTPVDTVAPTDTPAAPEEAPPTEEASPTEATTPAEEPVDQGQQAAPPAEEPTATSVPTNTPVPEPTAPPTDTPAPPEPTATPTATATNTPQPEPTATPTLTPTDTPLPPAEPPQEEPPIDQQKVAPEEPTDEPDQPEEPPADLPPTEQPPLEEQPPATE